MRVAEQTELDARIAQRSIRVTVLDDPLRRRNLFVEPRKRFCGELVDFLSLLHDFRLFLGNLLLLLRAFVRVGGQGGGRHQAQHQCRHQPCRRLSHKLVHSYSSL